MTSQVFALEISCSKPGQFTVYLINRNNFGNFDSLPKKVYMGARNNYGKFEIFMKKSVL